MSQAGYKYLKSYQLSLVIYDLTVYFCNCWIDKRSRTHDQMVQAARSGKQNISEGYLEKSLKMYIKLLGVARASLGELLEDYEDFARQNKIPVWDLEKGHLSLDIMYIICYTEAVKEYFSLGTFLKTYKNDEACLDHIKEIKYPDGILCGKCQKVTNFTKIKDRPVYQCSCGYQISPLAGTIFEKTTTPLQYWFYAIFIMTQTRSGISAKQLQRELGVTYKTAWRMFKQIRILMANANSGGDLLDGIVEADETFIGGKGVNRAYQWRADKRKEVVMGIVQRRGKAYLKHIRNTNSWTLINQLKEHVSPKAFVMTDDYSAYRHLIEHGFNHHYSIVHSDKEYVRGKIHTQNVENVWSILKRGIYGVYRVVSKKYLQAYIDEYSWRYNNRQYQDKMFDRLLGEIANVKVLKVV